MNNVLGTIAAVTATVLLAVLAVSMSKQATDSSATQNVLHEVQTLYQGTKTLYAGQSGYTGLSACELQQMNLVPANMIISGGSCGSLSDPWGGGVGAGPATSICPTCWYLQFNNVPPAACVSLATSISDPGWVCVGGACWNPPGYPGGSPLPVSWATSYCTSANNQLTFYYLN